MSDWITKALGKDSKKAFENSDSKELREASPDEEFVILLQGKNNQGNEIYSYLKMQFRNLPALQESVVNKSDFVPSDFGEVLAAGLGNPSAELREEMSETYDLVDLVPKDQVQHKPVNFSQPVPSIWDEED